MPPVSSGAFFIRTVRRVSPAALVVVALLLGGCRIPSPNGPADSFQLDFSMPTGSEVRGAVIFVVDGLNARIFEEMLDAGELPATRKYFADRGLYAPRAVANTPSVTMANLTSLVTGQWPGHHGVVGINWFDRNRLIWRDYETIAQKNTLDGDYAAANLYEQFPQETTVSAFFQAHRGATKFLENRISSGPPFLFGRYEFVDRVTLHRLHVMAEIARSRGRFPAVTICYLLAPDFRAYAHGVESRRYRDAIRHTDRQIGRVLGDLRQAGLLEKLLIVLTSDHGMGEVRKHFDMERFLGKTVGLRCAPGRLWEKTPFEKRLAHYQKYPCVVYGSGDGYWALCLRRPVDRTGKVVGFRPWPQRPTADDLRAYPVGAVAVDLPALLAAREAVDAVAYRLAADRVCVHRAAGRVEFHQPRGRGGPITYRVLEGDDPLGWADAAPQGRPMTPREWLEATAATNYPDLPAQILAYFRARRAGDMAVFAAPGWDFRNSNRAGHGGLRPQDMHVPLLLAGPGVPKGRPGAARTVDLMPTLLRLLGRRIPAGLDGRSLVGGEQNR